MSLEELGSNLILSVSQNPILTILGLLLISLFGIFVVPYLRTKLGKEQLELLESLGKVAVNLAEQRFQERSDNVQSEAERKRINKEKLAEATASVQQDLRDMNLGGLANNVPRIVGVLDSLLNQDVEHSPKTLISGDVVQLTEHPEL